MKLNLYIYENKNISKTNLNQGCICENKTKLTIKSILIDKIRIQLIWTWIKVSLM